MSEELNIFNMEEIDSDAFDFTDYRGCERRLLTPSLIHAGYTPLTKWYDIEADSFGPLVRGIKVLDRDDNVKVIYYA